MPYEPGSEFDGRDIATRTADVAPNLTVHRHQVALAETASVPYHRLAQEGHVVHAAEDASVCGLGEHDRLLGKLAEGVDGQFFLDECALNEADDKSVDCADIGIAHVCGNDGEERPRVGHKQALAAIKPEEIRVPVILALRHRGQGTPDGRIE